MDSDRKKRHHEYKERIFFLISCITSRHISYILSGQIIPQILSAVGRARLNKANLFKGRSPGHGAPQSYVHILHLRFFCLFLHFWRALHRVTVFMSPFDAGLRRRHSLSACGPQACFELRRVSQWRVGGRLNVRRTWPHWHGLMQACVWPLSLSPSNSVCLYPSVSSPPPSQMYMPSALAPHLWISCLQSSDSSALCAVSLCALRHLPRLNPLYPCKRDKPINSVRR